MRSVEDRRRSETLDRHLRKGGRLARSAVGGPGDAPSWVEPVARAGYAAKGAVYAVVGALAIRAALLGTGSDASGGREALQFVGSGPFGQLLLGLIAVGLTGYVVWRLVQATLDPEHRGDNDIAKDVARRGFYFGSALIYGFLTYYAIQLLIGSGGGGGGGTDQRVAELMSRTWGRILVGLFGLGVIAHGVLQGVKAYKESFRKKIKSFDFGPAKRRWVIAASRIGLTARGVVFLLIGTYFGWAALTHDPSKAGGTEQVLGALANQPWLLGAIGAGLCCYALYQWVKARYRLIAV